MMQLSSSALFILCCPSSLTPPTHPALPLNEAHYAACMLSLQHRPSVSPPQPPHVLHKTKFLFTRLPGSLHSSNKPVSLPHVFLDERKRVTEMQFKNIHKIFAIVQAMKTENPVHKSQLALVCSPLVKLSYSSCVKRN